MYVYERRFGAHRVRMSFQPFRASAAARMMPATSAASTRSSEMRAVRAYCSASARRSTVDGGEKVDHFGGRKGASSAVGLWAI